MRQQLDALFLVSVFKNKVICPSLQVAAKLFYALCIIILLHMQEIYTMQLNHIPCFSVSTKDASHTHTQTEVPGY
jgi:hypothetical protein